MNSNQLETEADADSSTTSESLSAESSSLSSSSYQNEDIRNKGGKEMKKKVKRLRSIKLPRLPSLKLTTRQAKVQSDCLSVLFSDAATSQQSTPMEMSDASPNYMKTTTCSNAKKERLQKTARSLTRRSSFKPAKSLTRLSSTKFRRPLMRKSSGGTEVKKKLKKTRSIKLASRSSIVFTTGDVKATSCSDVRNVQASPRNPESGLSSNDENRKSLRNPKLNFASSGDKPARVITRTSTLRPVRNFKKMASLKPKRASIMTCSQISDSSVNKATCSSVLKDSKFPDHLELQQGGSKSEGISAKKVCPYSYCSLHGHRHSALPPLKRFVSMRRRMLKTQKGLKLESRSSGRAKRFNNTKKGILSLNLDACKGDLESTSEADTSTGVADEPLNKSQSLTTNRYVESRAINNMVSSATVSEPQEEQIAASEENCKVFVQDYQFLTADSEPDFTTDAADKTQMAKQKHMGLWRLIYRHMVTGIAAENETQPPLDKVDKEEQGEDSNKLPGTNKFGSCQDFSGTDQSMDVEDCDGASKKIQLNQCDAIKLVQEAFDRILSEIPDQSSDDQSIVSDTTSDGELAVQSHGEGRELSPSNSFDSGEDSVVRDPEEMRLKADDINPSKGEKAESKVRNKSNQQTPRSWSNLKKIIILKRFVKALEKVRNFNPLKPQHLPVQPGPEAEKIHLRHQTTEERKNSEEWMLDYALQQVISTLAPSQKRKVALLVQAFETVTPLPEIGSPLRSNIVASSHASPVQNCAGSSDQKGSGNGEKTIFGVVLRKTSCLEMSFKENQEQVGDFCTAEGQIPVSCSELKETSLECGCIQTALSVLASETTATDSKEEVAVLNLENGYNESILNEDQSKEEVAFLKSSPKPDDVLSTSHEEFPKNGEVLQEVPEEVSSISVSEVHDCDFQSNRQKLESNDQNNETCEQSEETKSQIPENDGESVENNDVVSSTPVSRLLEKSSEVTEEENKLENKFPQGFTPLKESESSCTTGVALQKQKHMRLWYLIYKHMVSGSATLLEEADREEQRDDGSTLIGMNNAHSHQGFSITNKNINMENHDAGSQKIEIQQIEAIRLVEEAIDEIPIPEIQDESPNDQSVTSDIIPDQELLQKKPDKGELFISTSIGCTKESLRESNSTEVEQNTSMNPIEPWCNSDNIIGQEKEKALLQAGDKPKPSMQKSWSNLKKVILLNRFVKALEKVKNFNPREPRFLPLDPKEESEKVHLRHQDMEDRKNSDEWMLDYALQQVVAKLTPARKRKVELLVEAFETVIPTTGS